MSIMKKFNTILAIATVAISSVFGLTSCDKNDDSINNIPAPMPQQEVKEDAKNVDYDYQLFFSDEILSLGDCEITVENNGETTSYTASNGQAEAKTMASKDPAVSRVYNFNGKTVNIKNLKAGSKVTIKFVPDEQAIASLPADGSTNIGFSRLITGTNATGAHVSNSDDFPMPGLKNARVSDYITRRASDLSRTFDK